MHFHFQTIVIFKYTCRKTHVFVDSNWLVIWEVNMDRESVFKRLIDNFIHVRLKI